MKQDVGQSIIEGYSRIIETLAYTVMSRIEDVMYADSLVQNPSLAHRRRKSSTDCLPLMTGPIGEDTLRNLADNQSQTPISMTLSDFMGWNMMGDNEPGSSPSDEFKVATHKKSNSYLE